MTTDLGGAIIPSEAGFRMALILGAGISVLATILAACIPAATTKKVATAVILDQESTVVR
ncbi:hypothetical protein [Arthrobacter psychrolactophilus]